MAWLTVGVVGGSALLGAYQQQKQADATARQNQANMMAQAAQTRYSPWTGAGIQNMPGQAVNQTAAIDGALAGGFSGLGQMQKINEFRAQQAKAAQAAQPQANNANYSGTAMAGGAADYDNPWAQMSSKRSFWKDPGSIA